MPAKGFTHESTHNETKEWYTPREIFTALGVHFDCDPCSPGADIIPWIPAAVHYTIRDDGLTMPWVGNIWLNPPYGSDTPFWMQRLRNHKNGIALVFARPDTAWFHDYVPKADAICFIKGRIHFVPANKADQYADGQYRPKAGCGAASMLVAYGEQNAEALFKSQLGLTLPVRRSIPRCSEQDVASAVMADVPCACSNENRPGSTENGQGLFERTSICLRI